MQSIFWPSSGINERYDLKGCTGGRTENPQDLTEFNEIVMKDGNFLHAKMNLGENKLWYVLTLSQSLTPLNKFLEIKIHISIFYLISTCLIGSNYFQVY